MRPPYFTLIALVAGVAPLSAQTGPLPGVRPPATAAEAAARQRYEANLPIRTAELRAAGVHDTTITRVVTLLRERQVDPDESDRILIAERDAARENGPTDNLGDFVQRELDAGKRGPELAAAIRVEHQAHGHGPQGQGQGAQGGRAPGAAHGAPAGSPGRGRKP